MILKLSELQQQIRPVGNVNIAGWRHEEAAAPGGLGSKYCGLVKAERLKLISVFAH